MATNLKVPGVYVQEISTLPPSVAAVDTAIPAFVGYTEKGPSVPTRITSFLEYVQLFGGPDEAIVITANLTNEITATQFQQNYMLYYTVQSFFSNGGGPCYIVSAGTYKNATAPTPSDFIDKDELIAALALLEAEDEPTLLVIPEAALLGKLGEDTDNADAASVYQAALLQCNSMKDRFTIIDFFPNDITSGVDFTDAVEDFREALTTNSPNYGATYFPQIVSTYTYSSVYRDTAVFINGGTYDGDTLADVLEVDPLPTAFIAAVRAAITAALPTAPRLVINPSGYVSGVYAYVDANRGVWKAPANVGLIDLVGPAYKITDDNQADLNVDETAGKSINAIRTFTGKGTLIWGARTLDGNSSEWRYVNVRRLFIFVEESLQKATGAFVFEPNSAQTWTRVKGMIDNFLTDLWRQGALVGAKPSDAFFVNVGLGTTMTATDILDGVMNIEIGLAASRPAEFIVLKFTHKMQVS